MKRIFSIVIILIFCNVGSYSQNSSCKNTSPKALNVGEYKYNKIKRNTYKVLEGQEAYKAVEKRISNDKELQDMVGGYLEEQEIYCYYPEEDVALFNDPVMTVALLHMGNGSGYGDPKSYLYSPSKRYRFSTLDADGYKFFLEEKINDKYELCESVRLGGVPDSYYWEDENTLHFLVERERYDEGTRTYTKYWIGYSTKIIK